jgi:hypothetical protein
MFEEAARQWVSEMLQEGKLSGCDEEFLKQLTKDYARQLEEIFTCEVKKIWRNQEKWENLKECCYMTVSTSINI